MKKFHAVPLSAAVLVCMWSKASIAQDSASNEPQPSRWSIALDVAVWDNAYAGRGTQVLPFPIFQFNGDTVFIHGMSGGLHLLNNDSFTIDAILTPAFYQMSAKDFDRNKLATRGINRDDLDNRDLSIDAGFSASWHGDAGRLQLDVKTDISGNSEGPAYTLRYAYPFQVSGFRVTPFVGVDFLSSKVANYYYGIHPDEESRGVPGYKPGASLIPNAGVAVMHPLGKKWSFSIGGQFGHLPDKIRESPLVDQNRSTSVFVGINRSL